MSAPALHDEMAKLNRSERRGRASELGVSVFVVKHRNCTQGEMDRFGIGIGSDQIVDVYDSKGDP